MMFYYHTINDSIVYIGLNSSAHWIIMDTKHGYFDNLLINQLHLFPFSAQTFINLRY